MSHRTLFLTLFSAMALMTGTSAQALCEYCTSADPWSTRCKEVTDAKPNGNDDCRTGIMGGCTYEGTSCKKGGRTCSPDGDCDPLEKADLLEPREILEGEPLIIEAAPRCGTPRLIIEA
jgi:hypothetical protein